VTVQILGGGCAKCRQLEKNAREAIARLGWDAEVAEVTDSDRIMEMGVMVTPALAVDGTVKKSGAVLSVEQIVEILKGGASTTTRA
jgi:small redox-active disulfide protein 2